MRFGVRSDKGRVREINEDSYNIIAGYSGVPASFIVADGMGGHNSGEIASRLAVDFLSTRIMKSSEYLLSDGSIQNVLAEFMRDANTEVYRKSEESRENYGMGTTCTLCVVHERKLYVAHVGDSRLYLIRNGRIERITTDHSFIEELIKNGSISREEAEKHPKKNIITRAIGGAPDLDVDTYSQDIFGGDIFLICSDGLTNMVGENEIRDIVLLKDDPDDTCANLIHMANENGGEDNITVIVMKFS